MPPPSLLGIILYPIPYYSPLIPTLSWGGGGGGSGFSFAHALLAAIRLSRRVSCRQKEIIFKPLFQYFREIDETWQDDNFYF